jgi:hypothetical protein
MAACAYSRVPVRTLPKFRRRAEGWIARESTCWKLCSRASDRPASDGPRTIPRRLCRTASVKSQVNKGDSTRALFAERLGPARAIEASVQYG